MKMRVPYQGAITCALLSVLFHYRTVVHAADCPARGFAAGGTFRAGTLPSAVTVGDFNRDSRLDLAVANEFSENISILLGRGDGTFGTATNYAAGSVPSGIAAGDFNGDQRIDLAVANAGSTNVAILLGNGNGSFQAPVGYGVGEVPRSVTVADFNRDGRLDLALANRLSADVSVLLGRGDGTFQDASSHGAGIDPVSVAAGDFNGDSNLDLAVANAALFEDPPNVSVLIARNTGGFRNAVNFNAGISPRAVAVADFNRDGRADLAVANFGDFVGSQFTNSSVSVLLGNGDGTFATAVNHRAQDGPIAVVAADVNGNGLLDMVVVNNRSRTVSLLSGRGDGAFDAPLSFPAGFGAKSVALGDFNGDTHPDLAVANDTGALVLLNVCLTNADLSITKIDAPDPVVAGSNLTYTLFVTNAGPAPAPDAALIDPLPAGMSFLSATSSQGTCANNSGIVNCALGNLTVGGTATITIIVAAVSPGRFTNTATVTSSVSIDQNPTNNSASVTTTVLPLVSITATDLTASETGPNPGVFTVRRTGSTSAPLTVAYTISGTAANGADYASISSPVTIPAGSAFATITVAPVDELVVEPTETVIVTLASNPAYLINAAANTASVSIQDDDVYGLSINDVSVTEGNAGAIDALFTVSLSYAHTQTVTLRFATANGTATAGLDYQPTNGILSFAPGVTSQSINVAVLADALNEDNETFLINLSEPVNGVITDGQGAGTINNDDPLPSLLISDATVTEQNSVATNAVFLVTLSAVSGRSVSVNFATTNATANAGSDYIATNGTLTFPPGITSQAITINVNGDLLNESDESFLVLLSDPVNTLIADAQGAGTITNDDPLPSVSINDVTLAEGNSGGTNAIFTLGLSAISGQTVTISFATTNETANAGSDYVATSGTVVFPPGTGSRTIPVRVIGDLLNEIDEAFLVQLFNPSNVVVSDAQGIATINNDDPLPELLVNDVTITEGGANVQFTVSLSAVSGQAVAVNFATTDITASAGNDYLAANGLLSFPPGTTSQSVTVTILNDPLNEADETFRINLSSPVNALIRDGQGTGTINNDDPLPELLISDATVTEAAAVAQFTVSLSAASGQAVTVSFATVEGTATAGTDYTASSGLLSFPPGTISQNVSVTIINDALNEAAETFLVTLSSAGNAVIRDGQATGTINNDDPLPGVSISDVAITEGNAGTTNASFVVRLSALSGQIVSVNYVTADGLANAGADYTSTTGTLTLPRGTISQTITVPVRGDLLNESNETFLVNLSNPSNAILSDSQGTGTINNDDPVVSITITDASVVEGNSGSTNAVFTVSLSAISGQSVTVNYATANGTTVGNDYTSANGTLRFNPGQTNQFINVAVDGDTRNENNETFLVNLTSPVNATLADAQGVGTIINDEGVSLLSITDATVTEGDSGTVNAILTVRLSPTSASVVNVSYSTADDTAVAGSDYRATNGVLSFASGTGTQFVTVRVIGDRLNEASEAFLVNLFNASNALIADAQGRITIQDDDVRITALELSGANVTIRFTTATAQRYRVERIADPAGTLWAAVASDVAGTGGIVSVTDLGGAGQPSRFYRIVRQP